MNAGLHRFIDLLLQSGFVSREQVDQIRSQMSEEEKSDASNTDIFILEQLAESGCLTELQASTVREGKSDDLILDEYLIIDEIGKGGMGHVYRARHTLMQRDVAVKFPLGDEPSKKSDKRFRREVEALSKLVHPNIVSALDAGYQDNRCYLVMEYVQGTNLSTHVRENGPMPFVDALAVLIQAAEGLQYIHRKNIIHRDIKPGNLLLTPDGIVKLLDVGLARYAETNASQVGDPDKTNDDLTQRGQIVGTVDYMAPEQAITSQGVTPAADIYALGCTFHYLVMGTPPFRKQGKSPLERIIAHRETEIPLLSQRCREVPAEFDPIFSKMLAKEPEKRYTDASQLLVDLKRMQRDYSCILSGIEIGANEVQSQGQRRKTGLLSGMGLFAIVLVVSGVFYQWRYRDQTPGERPQSIEQRQNANAQPALPVDLMSYVDVERHALTGENWQFSDGLLRIPDSSPSKLMIPVSILPDYRLMLTVRRLSGNGPLVLFLPVRGASQCFLLVDAGRNNDPIWGLGFDASGQLVEIARTPPKIRRDAYSHLEVEVRTDGVTCMLDQQIALEWSGDPGGLRMAGGWTPTPEPTFAIGSNHTAAFEVSQLRAEPL